MTPEQVAEQDRDQAWMDCRCHVRRAVDAHQKAKRALLAYKQGRIDALTCDPHIQFAEYDTAVCAFLDACSDLDVDPYDALREGRK